ncbi:MAG: chondroitinase-B domain-containing protein [Bacteroidota bacterium]
MKRLGNIGIAGLVVLQILHGGNYRVTTPTAFSQRVPLLQPGDTITLAAGVWNNAQLNFAGSGTLLSPILMRAESQGGVVFSGSSYLRIGGNYLVVDGFVFENGSSPSGAVIEFRTSGGTGSTYCRLTNTKIKSYNPGDSTLDYKWVSLYGSYNRVDHCWFEGKTHSGTTLVVWLSAQPNYHRIDHNYFGPRPNLGFNGGETIRVGTSDWSMYDSYTTVEYNLFERCDGEIEIISNKSCENVYRYNVFLDNKATLTLRHGNRCSVYGNFFFAHRLSSSGGIRIIGEDHKVFNNYIEGTTGDDFRSGISLVDGIPNSALNGYFQVKRAIVVFNTLVNNTKSITVGAGKSATNTLPPLDCTIANNVVVSSYSPLITLTDTPGNMTWEGNVLNGATVGTTLPPSNQLVNPQLVLGTDSLWRPQQGSPALKSAVGSYAFVTDDMDGQARVAPFDAGADELASGGILRTPITRNEVGPVATPTTMESERVTEIPRSIMLNQNFPNPFNPETVISFQLSAVSQVILGIYDVLGREVAVLLNERLDPGVHAATWNASQAPSGMYFSRLIANGSVQTKKMILAK